MNVSIGLFDAVLFELCQFLLHALAQVSSQIISLLEEQAGGGWMVPRTSNHVQKEANATKQVLIWDHLGGIVCDKVALVMLQYIGGGMAPFGAIGTLKVLDVSGCSSYISSCVVYRCAACPIPQEALISPTKPLSGHHNSLLYYYYYNSHVYFWTLGCEYVLNGYQAERLVDVFMLLCSKLQVLDYCNWFEDKVDVTIFKLFKFGDLQFVLFWGAQSDSLLIYIHGLQKMCFVWHNVTSLIGCHRERLPVVNCLVCN